MNICYFYTVFPETMILRTVFFFVCLSSFCQKKNLTRHEIIQRGLEAYRSQDTLLLKNTSKELLKLFEQKEDSLSLAKYYHYNALEHRIKFNLDSTYFFYNESRKVSLLLNDSLEVGRRLLSIAVIQRQARDFLGSEVSAVQALQFLEPLGIDKSSEFLESTYNCLGLASEELNQKEEAIKYYNKVLDINKINKNERGYLFTINNLGLLYQKQQKHEKAIEYFRKGLSFKKIQIKYPSIYALLLENLAYSNFSLRNEESILNRYQKVLKIRDSLKDFKELGTTHINICLFYKRNNNLLLAKQHAAKALEYAKISHNNKRWLEALEELSELSSGEQSKKYFQEYIHLNDSLLQKERSLKNQFAKIRYETDKKEKENEVLKTENEKKQEEIVRQKQQKLIGWLLAVTAFLGMGFTATVFIFRRRKLLYQAQLQKAHAREQERKQIAKALHDEVAGDLRLLHKKLEKSALLEEAKKLDAVKENVRNLSHQLSSVSFKKVGFKDQLINLVSDYFEPNFRILLRGLDDQDWSTMNSAVKRLLYICIRESIQNSKKHAQATEVVATFSVHKKNVLLNITDNGIGFDTTIRKKGIGLHNLQERVEELQGTFSIESTVGNGTKTDIQIPLDV